MLANQSITPPAPMQSNPGYTWSSQQSGAVQPPAQPGKRPPLFLLIAAVLVIILGIFGAVAAVYINQTNTANAAATASALAFSQAQATTTAGAIVQASATAQKQASATAQANTTPQAQGKQPALAPVSAFANIAGTYSGIFANSSGTSANMTLVIQQNKGVLTGELTDYPPLAPATGPIKGTTGADTNGFVFLKFTWQASVQNGECGKTCTLDFRGYLYTDETLGGAYTIEQDAESGTWTTTK
jgi:hypothetical protein